MSRTLALLLVFACCCRCPAETPTNVLLITVDDMSCRSVGAFGCELEGITPRIDRLAAEGMRFEQAHVTAAICQPTRAVWMTGRYPHRSGALGFDRIDAGVPTLPEALARAGYLCGLFAKEKHVVPSRAQAFHVIVGGGELGQGRNPEEYGKHASAFFARARDEGKPFFLMANSQDPHRPFAGSAQAVRRSGRRATAGKPVPASVDPFAPDQVTVPGFLPDLPPIREELAQYDTSVRRADATVGALLDALEESGMAGSTLVIFLSDHGMPLPFGKANCWRESTLTPLVVRGPDVAGKGAVDTTHVIGGVDLAPTILQAVGLEPLGGTDGRSFLPLLQGEEQSDRDRVFTHINTLSSKKSYPMRAVQDRRFGYIWNAWSDGETVYHSESQNGLTFRAMQEAAKSDPAVASRVKHYELRTPEELYDHASDPDSLHDLSADPEYAVVLRERRRQLLAHMEATADPQFASYREFLAGLPGGGLRAPEKEAKRSPMLVLGRTQLLDGASAFPEFCARNEGAQRSELRARTIAQLKEIARAEQPALLRALGSPAAHRSLWLVNAVVVEMTEDEARAARELDEVKYVYPAGRVVAAGDAGRVATVLPRTKREPFSAEHKLVPWNLEALHASRVWSELGVTGEGVLLVSFDNGVNYRQQDLRGNIWINDVEVPNNGKDDDGNGLVDDLYGFDFFDMKCEVLDTGERQHGTLTASLAVGDGTGGMVTGVAPRARLMPIIARGGAYNAARAFEYVLEAGGDIVTMSFSIPDLGDVRGLWRLMAEQATCAGLVLVSGAGNFQQQAKIPEQIRIPEGIPCVICAGGVGRDLGIPRFVSLGPVEWANVRFYGDYPMPEGLVKPDVCAFPGPGVGLVSTADEGYLPDDNTRRGNSLSSPQAAGVAALVLSANPELPAWRVKQILEATARDLPPEGKDTRTGAGLLDAFAAVRAALQDR